MILGPRLRKGILAVHLTFSLGWIGAIVAYLALGVAAMSSSDLQTVRAAWIGMELTGWLAIVPLALGALLSGVVLSLGTPWGLFRHYWVVISLALTILCVVVLLLHMPSVTATAAMLRQMEPMPSAGGGIGADRSGHGAPGGDLFHSGIGLVVLLVVTVLNVCKPRGLTPYGWRKQQEWQARRAVRVVEGEPAPTLDASSGRGANASPNR